MEPGKPDTLCPDSARTVRTTRSDARRAAPGYRQYRYRPPGSSPDSVTSAAYPCVRSTQDASLLRSSTAS